MSLPINGFTTQTSLLRSRRITSNPHLSFCPRRAIAPGQQQPRERLRQRVERAAIGQRDRQPRAAGGVFLHALPQAISDLCNEALGGRLSRLLGHQLAKEIEDGPQHLAAGRRYPLAALG